MWHLLLNYIDILHKTVFFAVLKFYNFSLQYVDIRFWQLSATIQKIAQYPSWW